MRLKGELADAGEELRVDADDDDDRGGEADGDDQRGGIARVDPVPAYSGTGSWNHILRTTAA